MSSGYLLKSSGFFFWTIMLRINACSIIASAQKINVPMIEVTNDEIDLFIIMSFRYKIAWKWDNGKNPGIIYNSELCVCVCYLKTAMMLSNKQSIVSKEPLLITQIFDTVEWGRFFFRAHIINRKSYIWVLSNRNVIIEIFFWTLKYGFL